MTYATEAKATTSKLAELMEPECLLRVGCQMVLLTLAQNLLPQYQLFPLI